MTATIDTTSIDERLDAEKIISSFERLLVDPDPSKPRGPLWYAWHYLQVYSFWGLRLPNTDATLKLKLGIKDPGAYLFYGTMLEGYQKIHEACEYFLDDVFSQMVDLGNDLQTFATEASNQEGDSIFSAVTDLIDSGKTTAALELLDGLQDSAKENATKAENVKKALGRFKTRLVDASGKVHQADDEVENDIQTSQATIDRLMSTAPDAVDSLAAIHNLLNAKQEEYKEDVTIAATTPTYCWVVWPMPPFPVGLVAAVTVASIYGSRAVDALKRVEELRGQYDEMFKACSTAIAAHTVQTTAKLGLDQAKTHTDKAIDQTTAIQNTWEDVVTQIGVLKTKTAKMTTEQDGQKVLAAEDTIKTYANTAIKAWGKILPPLTVLTTNPYISISNGEVSFADFAAQVQQEIDKGNKPA